MLGFIGAGNMATAIIKGIVSSKLFKGEDIAVYDTDLKKAKALSDLYGVYVSSSASEAVRKSDRVVLAVKPDVISAVVEQTAEAIKECDPLIISIATGKTTDYIASCLAFDARIVRVMPNINAVAGQAISAYCAGKNALSEDIQFVHELCSSFGKAIELPEKQFPIFAVIGGCSPAFVYMFIDAMARAAVKNGLAKDKALEISAQAVLGSAEMILKSGEHPWSLIDKVCSPGGTTVEGVLSLQKNGFESAVADAVNAAFEKDRRL